MLIKRIQKDVYQFKPLLSSVICTNCDHEYRGSAGWRFMDHVAGDWLYVCGQCAPDKCTAISVQSRVIGEIA